MQVTFNTFVSKARFYLPDALKDLVRPFCRTRNTTSNWSLVYKQLQIFNGPKKNYNKSHSRQVILAYKSFNSKVSVVGLLFSIRRVL